MLSILVPQVPSPSRLANFSCLNDFQSLAPVKHFFTQPDLGSWPGGLFFQGQGSGPGRGCIFFESPGPGPGSAWNKGNKLGTGAGVGSSFESYKRMSHKLRSEDLPSDYISSRTFRLTMLHPVNTYSSNTKLCVRNRDVHCLMKIV